MKGLGHPSRTPQASRRAQGEQALLRSLFFFFFLFFIFWFLTSTTTHSLVTCANESQT